MQWNTLAFVSHYEMKLMRLLCKFDNCIKLLKLLLKKKSSKLYQLYLE